jgi:hypothetical protein
VRHLLRAIEREDLQAVKTGRQYVMTAEAVRAYWAQSAAGPRYGGAGPPEGPLTPPPRQGQDR